MLDSWKILAPLEACNRFKEKIIYTFYGVSKFVIHNTKPEASKKNLTACIILESTKCIGIVRIYPFDSGAISGEGPSHPKLIEWEKLKEDMNLGSRLSRINKLMLFCYPSLDNYVKGEFEIDEETGIKKIKGKYKEKESIEDVEDLRRMMRSLTLADDRIFNYEVQFKEKLELLPEAVVGFVVRAKIMDEMIKHHKRYVVPAAHGFYYPSSLETNYDVGQWIKAKTKDFTLSNYLNVN